MTAKILLICQHFYPDMVSTGLHMTELTTEWKKLYPDVEISVFTGENAREHLDQPFKRYEIYQKINIFRVKNIGKQHRGLFQRLLFSLGFVAKTFLFLLNNGNKYNLLLTTTNPPFIGMVVWFFNLVYRIPYVIIVYDIYPQILDKMGILNKNSLLYIAWGWFNRSFYSRASKIISIGSDMTRVIKAQISNKNWSKIELIDNWSDKSKVFPVPSSRNQFVIKNGFQGKKILLYSGTIGSTHNVEDILEAASQLKAYDEIIFLFIGAGAKAILVQKYIDTSGCGNVILLPFQPIETLSDTLSSATMSFVCLNSSFTGLSVPSKSYAVMAAKVPIIAMMDDDAAISEIVIKYECGIVWNSRSKVGLASVILGMVHDESRLAKMGQNGYDAFLNNFNINTAVNKYNNVVRKVLVK